MTTTWEQNPQKKLTDDLFDLGPVNQLLLDLITMRLLLAEVPLSHGNVSPMRTVGDDR